MTIFLNNLKRIFKSKGNLILMLVFPIVFITLSMSMNNGGEKISVGVVDHDNTKFTHMLVDSLKQKNSVVDINSNDVKKQLLDNNVNYVLEIDKNFTNDIINGKDVSIKGYGLKETNVSLPTSYYVESFLNTAKNIGTASKGNEEKFYTGLETYAKGSFSSVYKDVNGTSNKTSNTLQGLGFLIMSMIFLSSNASQLILEDKSEKTFFRIFASPISTKRYMLENVLSAFAILIIQLIAIFIIMVKVFKADFGPSVLNVFGLYVIFSLVCVSLGVAIASISKDTRQAGSISTFVTVPMCMIGGCFWPREFMPDILLKISNFMPTTWVLKASDKVMHGASLASVSTEISILLLFTLVFILLGSWRKTDITK